VTRDGAHWAAYNDDQGGRPARPLLADALALAGAGVGRRALDLGCGAGIETAALLRAGWAAYAIDAAPGTCQRLHRIAAGGPLTVQVADLARLDRLPSAALVYAGYALPYLAPAAFHRLWRLIRGCLQPGGWLVVNLFGDRDEWAGTPGETFLSEPAARALLAGLDVHRFAVEDAVGPARGGPKHWHVFDIIARRPGHHRGPV
jgi:trans-aconitate methyltransferase